MHTFGEDSGMTGLAGEILAAHTLSMTGKFVQTSNCPLLTIIHTRYVGVSNEQLRIGWAACGRLSWVCMLRTVHRIGEGLWLSYAIVSHVSVLPI